MGCRVIGEGQVGGVGETGAEDGREGFEGEEGRGGGEHGLVLESLNEMLVIG